MRLRIITPTTVVVDEEVTKVVAEAADGSFCLLPRHIDVVSALVPGLLAYVPGDDAGSAAAALERGGAGPHHPGTPVDGEVFLAVDRGVLVKTASDVRVATRQAVVGPDLGALRRQVAERFETLDDLEVRALSALVRLESGFVRRLLELGEAHGG